jgi:hypothetical protein
LVYLSALLFPNSYITIVWWRCRWCSGMWHHVTGQEVCSDMASNRRRLEYPNLPLLNNSSLQTYLCLTIRVSKHISAQQFESPNLPLLNNFLDANNTPTLSEYNLCI